MPSGVRDVVTVIPEILNLLKRVRNWIATSCIKFISIYRAFGLYLITPFNAEYLVGANWNSIYYQVLQPMVWWDVQKLVNELRQRLVKASAWCELHSRAFVWIVAYATFNALPVWPTDNRLVGMIVDSKEPDSVLLGEDATQLGLPVWKVTEVEGHEGNALIDTSPPGNVLQNDAWLEARKQAKEYLARFRQSPTKTEVLRETQRRYSLQIEADISQGLVQPARDFWFARGPTSFTENSPLWICNTTDQHPIRHVSAIPWKKFLEVICVAEEVISSRASNQDWINLAYS